MKNLICILSAIFFNSVLFAQKAESMADTMRSNGKIYVVVAVILTIFAGLIIYLIRLDRKITRLEKEQRTS
jgi:hypothetical protein